MPKITRPKFPKGYVDKPKSEVSWEYVEEQLTKSKQYWICSVRPNGRPHVVPRWAVYLDEKIYYDGSPETRHAQNILQNPYVTVNLEDGWKAIFLEGKSVPAPKPTPELAERLAKAYRRLIVNMQKKAIALNQINGMRAACMFSRQVNASHGQSSLKTQPNLFLKWMKRNDLKNVAW